MSTPAAKVLNSGPFLDWAKAQPMGRYELLRGEIIAMAPERASHARAKLKACNALNSAIKRAGVQCEAFIDGLAVRINDNTVYEPDALVNCGPAIDGHVIEAPSPAIIVEVLSPSTQNIDKSAQLIDYFSLPCVHHYVVIDTGRNAVIHHRRTAGNKIETAVHRQGEMVFDPPGFAISAEDLLIAE